jgi:hypothetical protein
VAEFKEAYGQDFDEQIKNLAVEYEQTADGNTEAYFTLLTPFAILELTTTLSFNRPIALTLPNPLPRTKSLTNTPASLIRS